MSYEKDVRATVALLGGSMSTLVGPAAFPASHIVRKRTMSRRKPSSESPSRKQRNSTLGILGNLFSRKDKTQSAIFHLDEDYPDGQQGSMPLTTSLSLPYPLHPLPLEASFSSFSRPVVFAVRLSWAEEVQYADEMVSSYYDDLYSSSDEEPSSPEFANRQYSLMRRLGIRRKTAGKQRRRFTHSVSSGSIFPELADKLFRGLSAPATSGTETSDSDNPVNEDVVATTLPVVRRIIPSAAPCLIHRNMSQYIEIHLVFRGSMSLASVCVCVCFFILLWKSDYQLGNENVYKLCANPLSKRHRWESRSLYSAGSVSDLFTMAVFLPRVYKRADRMEQNSCCRAKWANRLRQRQEGERKKK